MRKAVRIAVLFFLSLLSTAVFAVGAALIAAVSLAATTALIVPGTGTPNANEVDDYLPNYWDRYIGGVDPSLPGECTLNNDCTLTGINYPASFFPLVIFPGWCEPGRCETWNDSVGEGVTNLNAALIETWADDPTQDIVIGGYSQGGAVASNELRNLAGLSPELKEKIKVFLIGNAYNPDGGIFTRLGFLPTIPFLDITFGPATPVDTGIDMTGIGFEYDPVMYAPQYWGNPLALLNAFAAFATVHGYYLSPNENNEAPIAYGYTEEELAAILATDCPGAYCRVGSEGNNYYMIPAKSLPLMNLISSLVPEPLRPFVQPIIELVSPVVKVLIDLGYDWSGDPDQTRYLSLLPFNPFQNWLQVGVDLVEAAFEGLENASGGGSMMIAPPSGAAELASLSQDSGGVEGLQPHAEADGQLGYQDLGGQPAEDQELQGVAGGQQSDGLESAGQELQGEVDGEELAAQEPEEGAQNQQLEARIEDQKDGTIDANGGSVSLNFSPNGPEGVAGEQGGGEQESAEDPAPTEVTEGTDESEGAEPAAA
jgi:hypothetical protein